MSGRPPRLPSVFRLHRRRPLAAFLAVVLAAGPGCSAVKLAGKATAATVSATTDVACATVRGTGKVVYTAADVSVDLASGGIRAASKLSKAGAVVLFDARKGVVAELPWTKNLTLLAAMQMSGLGAGTEAVRLIRAGRAIQTTKNNSKLVLASGDVVELTARPAAKRARLR